MRERFHFATGAALKFTHEDGSVFRLDVGAGVLEVLPAATPGLTTSLSGSVEPEAITRLVAAYFNVPLQRIRGKSKRHEAFVPRAVAAFVARDNGASFPAIGRALARHHASIMNACRWVTEQLDNGNVRLKQDLLEIQRRLDDQQFESGALPESSDDQLDESADGAS